MMARKGSERRLLRSMLLGTAFLLFTAAILGGVLRSLDGLGSCGGWPLCGGAWIPREGSAALWLDYSHRLTSGLAGLSAAAGLIYVLWKAPRETKLLLPLVLANLLIGGQMILGSVLQHGSIEGTGTAVHFGLALLGLGLTLTALIVSTQAHGTGGSRSFSRRYLALAVLAVLLIGLVLVSGAVVTARDASGSCPGWPLCSGFSLDLRSLQGLVVGHRLSVLAAGIGLAALLVQAWREGRDQPALLTSAAAALVLFLSQGLMGSRTSVEFTVFQRSLHQAAGVGVWSAVVIHGVLLAGLHRSGVPEFRAGRRDREWKATARDLLNLTKPIVVSLLLVTTFAGMVIGAEAWPSVRLTLWVLLAGFLAAGGAGAINQFIDRGDDLRMQRTQDRPIPSGRVTPAEGLAFGTALTITGFYLMAAFVNQTAALLTLAGAVYYVLIYSIFLKKTTVHNIVIGGGAGAVPPLVGWAAATGGLNVPALFLFAVVFLWTPPHFWALAIVRRKDYARAEIPMLPVVQGEEKTRRQIFVYTVELVLLTLILPLFGLGGSIYFVLALALGLWLLSAAWKVLKEDGNKVAWRMYRYSSMYLAFLFAALMVDALV